MAASFSPRASGNISGTDARRQSASGGVAAKRLEGSPAKHVLAITAALTVACSARGTKPKMSRLPRIKSDGDAGLDVCDRDLDLDPSPMKQPAAVA